MQCPARLTVSGAGSAIVNGAYQLRSPSVIPEAFAHVCRESKWEPRTMWTRLNGEGAWWESDNTSYVYFNKVDSKWWLDSGLTGLGLYITLAGQRTEAPPLIGWQAMGEGVQPVPSLHF